MSHKEKEIIQWGVDRNIVGPTGQATPEAQIEKTFEEVQEVKDAIAEINIENLIEEIGDVYVTLILQCKMWDISMNDCIDAAYEKIKDRKGIMIQGKYVKQSNIDKLEFAGFKTNSGKIYTYAEDEIIAEELIQLVKSINLEPEIKFNNLYKKIEVYIQ